jgi:hypothetical protein
VSRDLKLTGIATILSNAGDAILTLEPPAGHLSSVLDLEADLL